MKSDLTGARKDGSNRTLARPSACGAGGTLGLGVSNDYVKDGYEASFGSYDVNEEAHTVTHHVEGSITQALVGKDLPRLFQFSDGHLIIRSTRPDEYWSVTWEHY